MKIRPISQFFLLLLPIWANGQSSLDEWLNHIVSFGVVENIEMSNSDGGSSIPFTASRYRAIGSGTLFFVHDKDSLVPVLITAQHVFEDSLKAHYPLELNYRPGFFRNTGRLKFEGRKLILKRNGVPVWYRPDDKSVDLAGIPLEFSKFLDMDLKNVTPRHYKEVLKNEKDLNLGDDILVLGYPSIGEDDVASRLILRHGILAFIPTALHSYYKIFIDSEVFPGNSGGPIISQISNEKNKKEYKVSGVVSKRFKPLVEIFDKGAKPLIIVYSSKLGIVEPVSKIEELLNKIETHLNTN